MAYFAFTARRSIASGYTSGQAVSFKTPLQKLDFDFKPVNTKHVSISGKRFTWTDRVDQIQSVTIGPFTTDSTNDLIKMFLDSVLYGETFSASFESDYAGGASNYILESTYQKKRVVREIFTYEFKVIAV